MPQPETVAAPERRPSSDMNAARATAVIPQAGCTAPILASSRVGARGAGVRAAGSARAGARRLGAA